MTLVLKWETVSSSGDLITGKITKAMESILNKATKMSRKHEFGENLL